MSRWFLLLALLATSCSPSCQREASAFFTGETRCANLDVFIRGENDTGTRIVCDRDEVLDLSCAGMRREWSPVNVRPVCVEVWCGSENKGRYCGDTVMGE